MKSYHWAYVFLILLGLALGVAYHLDHPYKSPEKQTAQNFIAKSPSLVLHNCYIIDDGVMYGETVIITGGRIHIEKGRAWEQK